MCVCILYVLWKQFSTHLVCTVDDDWEKSDLSGRPNLWWHRLNSITQGRHIFQRGFRRETSTTEQYNFEELWSFYCENENRCDWDLAAIRRTKRWRQHFRLASAQLICNRQRAYFDICSSLTLNHSYCKQFHPCLIKKY